MISSGDGKMDFIYYGIIVIDGEEGIVEVVVGINRRIIGFVIRGRCIIGIWLGEDMYVIRFIDWIFKSEFYVFFVGEGCCVCCW